jgi:glycosyltransferase involved in cell wall biosynthesis
MIKAELLDMPRKKRDRVTIGYQGGLSHLIDLCSVQNVLRGVLDANPDADMHWIGQDFSPLLYDYWPFSRGRARYTPWCDDVGDYYRQYDFDIAIAPLADVPFNAAKSHLKALEAAARGVPVIATDAEPYREFIVDGETGYLVRSEEEWAKRLTDLIHDEQAREEMGAAAKKVAAKYTIQENYYLWDDAYREAAG